MRQRKPYIDALRTELMAHGLYHEKLERLITEAGMAKRMIDRLESELDRSELTITQVGSQRQTKIMQHPHVESLVKYKRLYGNCLIALGLSNKEVMRPDDEDSVDRFLNSLL